jgi:hypothetical protein
VAAVTAEVDKHMVRWAAHAAGLHEGLADLDAGSVVEGEDGVAGNSLNFSSLTFGNRPRWRAPADFELRGCVPALLHNPI